MPITISSGTGNISDPYFGLGSAPPENQMQASYEGTYFQNFITCSSLMGYDTITNISVTNSIDDLPVTLNDITNNGQVNLNDVTYIEPEAENSTKDIPTIAIANPLITITGNLGTLFKDKYYKHKTIPQETDTTVNYPDGINDVPNSSTHLYLYKPSFMRFNVIYYYISITHFNSSTLATIVENVTASKRIINDWDTQRLALISKLNTIGI